MAVFGLPRLHEDDALRAVRAAAGMQRALEALNGELERVYGVQLANRTGVNTGEVVAGDPSTGQRLVTGDAVNVAARLEQAAGEQEVLLGELTYRLVRDSVEVEEVEPLALKGKSEPVPAYRLVGVKDTGDVEIRRGAPLVGRERELETLEAVFDEAVATSTARLATIVADAGVGKSRLTAEFLDRIADRAVAFRGRCLPYGDGITFWPLAEALKAAAGIVNEDTGETALAKLSALTDPAGAEVTERLAAMIGIRPEPFPMEELAWAMRRFLEHAAAERPVALVVEDVHWAEPSLLELVEQLVQAIDEAPVLVLCPARPTLLDQSPDFGNGERATRIVVEPLGDRREPRDGREPARRGRARHRRARPRGDRRRGQPSLRRAAPADARRRGRPPAGERRMARGRPPVRPPCPTDDPGASRGAPRRPRRGRALGDRAGVGGRLRVRRGRGRRAGPARGIAASRLGADDAGPEAARPAGRRRRRVAPPLPAHHDPRHRLRRHSQAGAGGSARAVRRMGGRGEHGPRSRVRGDPRLPPRAGLDVSLGARAARRTGPRDRGGRVPAARRGGQARVRARRRARPRRDASGPGRGAPARPTTPTGCESCPSTARRSS